MRTKFTLRRHIRQAHGKEDQFNCLCCDRSFCAKFSLTYHIKKNHLSLFGKHFDCEKCGETLSDFQAYRAHKADHRDSQEKHTVKCQYCDLDIKRASMRSHIAEVHNKEIRFDANEVVCMSYPYKCNKCEHAFKRKYDL